MGSPTSFGGFRFGVAPARRVQGFESRRFEVKGLGFRDYGCTEMTLIALTILTITIELDRKLDTQVDFCSFEAPRSPATQKSLHPKPQT